MRGQLSGLAGIILTLLLVSSAAQALAPFGDPLDSDDLQARAEAIVARAEALQRDDEAAVAEIQSGLGFSEAMKKFTRI